MISKWDYRFLELAKLVSTWSRDPSTQTGAVITDVRNKVVNVGYNGFPQDMPDAIELYADREEKYSRIIHAEMNSLLLAGRPLPSGCSLYTFPFMPCDRCVVHMLQAGIKRFVAPVASQDKLERWGEAFARTRKYIAECGGELLEVKL